MRSWSLAFCLVLLITLTSVVILSLINPMFKNEFLKVAENKCKQKGLTGKVCTEWINQKIVEYGF